MRLSSFLAAFFLFFLNGLGVFIHHPLSYSTLGANPWPPPLCSSSIFQHLREDPSWLDKSTMAEEMSADLPKASSPSGFQIGNPPGQKPRRRPYWIRNKYKEIKDNSTQTASAPAAEPSQDFETPKCPELFNGPEPPQSLD